MFEPLLFLIYIEDLVNGTDLYLNMLVDDIKLMYEV